MARDDVEIRVGVTGDAPKKLDKIGKAVTKNLKEIVALNQGFQLAGAAADVFLRPFEAIIKTGAGFQQQMANIKAISKTTAEEFAALSDEAERIGSTTKFTAEQAAGAMEELRRAGQSVNQTLATTQQAMDLSAASGLELSRAAQSVAVNLKVFKKEGLKAKKAVDLLNKTTGASATSIEELTGAVEASQGTAAGLGIKFKDLTSILGLLADAGVRGEKAGTALNGVLARLANPTAAVAKELANLGIKIDEVNPETNKFGKILDTLKKSGINTAQMLTILGQEAGPKFIDVINGGAEALDNMRKKQDEANTAAESAAIRLKTLTGKWDLYNSAVDGLKLNIFSGLADGLEEKITVITKAVGLLNDLVNKYKELGITMANSGISFARWSNSVVDSFMNSTTGLQKFFLALSRVKGFAGIIGTIGTDFFDIAKDIKAANDASIEQNKEWIKTSSVTKTVVKKLKEVADAQADITKKTKETTKAIKAAPAPAHVSPFLGGLGETSGKTFTAPGLDFGVGTKAQAAAGRGVVTGAASGITGVGAGISAGMATGSPYAALGAAVTDLISKSPAMQEALNTLNEAITAVFEPFFEAVAPLMEAMAPLLESLVPAIKILAGTMVPLIKPQTEAIKLLTHWVESLSMWAEHLGKTGLAALDSVRKGLSYVGNAVETILAPVLDNLIQPIKDILAPIKNLKTPLDNLKTPLEVIKPALDILGGAMVKLETAIRNISTAGGAGGGDGRSIIARGQAAITTGGLSEVKRLTGWKEGGLVPKAQTGMLVGNSHANGGKMIEAEGGEFIMSKAAVDRLGQNQLAALNSGQGGGGVTINVTAMDPRSQTEEIREVLEEMFLTGRLGMI